MKASQPWVPPLLLPERTNVVQPILNSAEYSVQESRVSSIVRSRYPTDFDVPLCPDPLNDVEQALDMTSQASAVVTPIPFFAPQLVLPSIAATESYVEAPVAEQLTTISSTSPAQSDKASFEFVQSLGLPFYLVGQPVEVIQTLSGNPSLLNTLLDSNGIYDQQKLMSLVQTMSSKGVLPNPVVSYQSTPASTYGMPFNASHYGDPAPLVPQSLRTITRKSDDGNLHVSGYGPGITEGDLIAAFSPYVHVDEVVLKGTFAFVNTSDPVNAQMAREALTGTLLNGMPIRINNATRKVRDTTSLLSAAIPPPPALPPFAQHRQNTFGSQTPTSISPGAAPTFSHPSFGAIHPNIDSVRDDKGNAPTKNLFVAGYGQGTNEQMLRDLFGQFAVVTGVVSKGTFAFVNTSDRHGAVVARENLGGTMFNGGILRINFAKETGRLGTSFDLTYGRNPGQNVNQLAGTAARQPSMGYYG
jgi:RNA recognition motif-containing protein